MDQTKVLLGKEVEAVAEDLFAASEFLYKNPEIGFQEIKAVEYLGRFLADRGFQVEKGIGGLKTSFRASPSGQPLKRPTFALLAEYDALPAVGHGCGHNLIAAASLGAALALKRHANLLQGSFAVVGTPAEEGGGGKILLADAGIFSEMDAAMMFHPGRLNLPGEDMIGRVKFKAEFFGKSAHASVSPDRGINALDAIVAAYNNIGMLRQQVHPEARIHGIITHGGDAPNVIPEYTAGMFYVRAASRKNRDEVFEKVKKCLEAGALATGAACKIEVGKPTFDPIRHNAPLEEAARENMTALGIAIDADDGRRGSSDIGNLSQVLPALHPSLAIVDPEIPGHSQLFGEATMTARGRETLIKAAKLLAMTAYDFLTSPELRDRIRADFTKGE
ncbi:MAG: N-acyl-L-amino acid amidohydrolase [Deltaproteobacteria bacterium]|nr:N-acyl-L-amino acid amidohydrolase [Deltaproteobacteria bacterium]